MDLITYLKNTNNEELYEKLKTIVKLYKERENNHKKLVELNKAYNQFLTEKHEREYKGKSKDKDSFISRLKTINPLLLLFFVFMLPTPILIVVCMVFNLLYIVKLIKMKNKIMEKRKAASIDAKEDFDQNKKYDQLCQVREKYHSKRKELDKALLSISKEDMDLINDFYGALQEYDSLLSLLSCDLEEKVELPQTEINISLNRKTNC